MKTDNVLQQKSYAFAVRVVRLCRHLCESKREYVLSKQLLRSGTSIGANVEESIGAQSRADFAAKLAIAYKEARESSYWLRLLRDTDYLNEEEYRDAYEEAAELCRIIGAIRKTLKDGNRRD